MKKAKTVLDFSKDTVTMFGQEQPLPRTSSGHYAIPVCPARLEIENSKSEIRKDYRFIIVVSQKCQICKVYKRVPPRPLVGLPWASNFNDTVAMDLITYKQGVWILHYFLEIQLLV